MQGTADIFAHRRDIISITEASGYACLHTHAHAHTHLYTYPYTCTPMHTYMHTHKYAHTFPHAQTYMHTKSLWSKLGKCFYGLKTLQRKHSGSSL